MQMAWNAGTDKIECRWSNGEGYVRYSAPWLDLAAGDVNPTAPALGVDFTRLSPFGGKWFML